MRTGDGPGTGPGTSPKGTPFGRDRGRPQRGHPLNFTRRRITLKRCTFQYELGERMTVLRSIVILIIIVFNFTNNTTAQVLTIGDCSDKNFITQTAELIVIGTVVGTNVSWNKNKTAINTYIDLRIEDYFKIGPSLEQDKRFKLAKDQITIVSRGGCIYDICQSVSDDAVILKSGQTVKVYLEFNREDKTYSVVCGKNGAEGMDLLSYQLSKDAIGRVRYAQDYGKISDKEAFMLEARLMFAPQTIDPHSEFALKPGEKLRPDECGTGFHKELHKVYPKLTKEEKELLKSWDPSCRAVIEVYEEKEK